MYRFPSAFADRRKLPALEKLFDQAKHKDGLTYDKLGEAIGVKRAAAHSYVTVGVPSNLEILYRLAAFFKVSPRQLDPKLPDWAWPKE